MRMSKERDRGSKLSARSRVMSSLVHALSVGLAVTILTEAITRAAPVAPPLPHGTHTSLVSRQRCGPYSLYPELSSHERGDERVVSFTAVNRSTHRADFSIAPAKLEAFRERTCARDPAATKHPSSLVKTAMGSAAGS